MVKLPSPYVYLDGVVAEPLAISALPNAVTLAGTTYQKRSHLHCTIVAVKKLVPQIVAANGVSTREAEDQVLQAIIPNLEKFRPHFTGFSSNIRVVSQEHKETIIVLANVVGFEEFFTQLNTELGISQPTQPAHVTLFAVNDRPIGLNSLEEVAGRSHALMPAESAEWGSQVDLAQSAVGAL